MMAQLTLKNLELPVFVQNLSYWPQKDKFIETHFLSHIDKLVNNLRQNGVNNEKPREIEASAKWYAKNQRETPMYGVTIISKNMNS